MNLMNKPPLGLKQPKPAKAPRKRVRQVSAKRAAHRVSDAGKNGSAYMGMVKQLPCVACGSISRPRDAHHCKDKPPLGGDGPYQKSPHKFRRSGDRDVIPLCKWFCHDDGPDSLHKNRRAWREKHGPDYTYIPPTRALVATMNATIDF